MREHKVCKGTDNVKMGESLLKKRRSPGAKVARSEGCQERMSPGVKVAMREREQLSGRGSLPARVAEVHLLALSHLEVCGEKNVGPCVAMLCVDVDIVHGCCKTTGLGLFHTKQVWCGRRPYKNCRVKPRGRESESVPNRNKTSYSLYFTRCVFNLVVNYPMIIITPRN